MLPNKLPTMLFALILLTNEVANSQCPANTTQYPTGTYTPTAVYGAPTTCNYSGEYYSLNVILGNTYEFSTCTADGATAGYDTQLQLTDDSQATLVFNDDFCGSQSYLSWTSTYTGVAQIHLYEYNCGSNSTCTSVMCRETGVVVPCTDTFPYTLDFESGLEWTATGPSASYNWLQNSGATVSSDTGPNDATVFGSSSTSNCIGCNYAYCETSGSGGTGTFNLTSNCFDFSALSSTRCTFSYHAFGATIGALSLEVSTDLTNWSPVWISSGQQHSSNSEAATTAQVDLSAFAGLSQVYLRFNYVAGGSYTGDVAIDDVVVEEGGVTTTCISTFPYTNNFESGLAWSATGPSGVYNWLQNSGSTSSSSTGPADATVFGADTTSNCTACNYAYCETSGSGSSGTFTLTSPCFDFSGLSIPNFGFDIHAFGGTIGTMELQSSPDLINWTTEWSVSGQQQFIDSEAATAVEVNLASLT